MKRFLSLIVVALAAVTGLSAAEQPLRIFIRSGSKSHGPGQHDHPRFLQEWVPMLNERGARATGGDKFPTAEQLAATDVVIIHAQEGGNVPDVQDRANLDAFLKRGGGLVVIHAGAVSRDPDWYKSIIGGSWRFGTTKWLEAAMHLYVADHAHPVTKGASNWAMEDEIYYDMDMSPDVRVLATAYTPKAQDTGGRGNKEAQARAAEAVANRKGVNIYDAQPQIWTYERTIAGGSKGYRAFVSLPGHRYENFNRLNYRAILLRGIAWAGQRANVDELCKSEELGDTLRYPVDGPTHPSKAAAKIEVHPEFNLSLVASEPLINKVMNLDWDERGRLWVCETPEYPNGRRSPNTTTWRESGSLKPTQTERDPEDRISILTDTNGDGIMDKKQVFADKLELVTSFVLYKRGVIAATAPDIWYLEDTDDDGVADKRTKLYTGLGINDTHAVINNLRWGLDGWIYATHGYSRGDGIKSGDGSKSFGAAGSGVVRFKPDGSAFEQYNSRNGNTWGLETTWDGQIFWTQPTSGTVFFHSLLPESVLAKAKLPGVTSWKGMMTNVRTFPKMEWPEQAYVQIDQVGRFTAAAGTAINESGIWPAKWDYSYFNGEATLNIVHHEFVRPEGSSYDVSKEKGREETEFIRSTDLWFRPIDTRIGPDGALYVIDFYNQAVIHNDTRGPLHGPANAAVRPDRDHYFSRIWRVQHKNAKKVEMPNLDRNNLASLIRAIETSPSTQVKKIAWRVARDNHGEAGIKALAAIKRPAIGSKAEQAYAEASAAKTPAERQAVLARYAQASDDWMRSALAAAAVDQAGEYVIEALKSPYGAALASFVQAVSPSISGSDAVRVLQATASASGPLRESVLRGLAGLSSTPALDASAIAALKALIQNPDTSAPALSVAARWDKAGALAGVSAEAASRLLSELSNASAPDTRRASAAAALLTISAQKAEALKRVGTLLMDARTPDSLKTPLLTVVGELPVSESSGLLIDAFAKTKSPAVFEQLLKRPESAVALLGAIKAGKLTVPEVGPGNLDRLRTHPNRRVATEAATVLASIGTSPAKDELIAKLLPEIQKPGDVANGRMLFTAACSVCHKFGDVGTRDVGPPLAGIGSHPAPELLAHIVDPNRQVEPNYWQWNIVTKKGETFVGVISNENNSTVTIRNQGGDSEIKKDDIATRENTRRSLMPEGFEGLGAEGLRNIIAYLATSAKADGAARGNVMAQPAAPDAPKQPAKGKKKAAEPDPLTGPKEGGRGDGALPETGDIKWEAGKTKVLIIGGGSSHKFTEFFNTSDSATLRAAGYSVNYTEDRDQAAKELAGADVAVISVNRKFFDTPEYRKAVFDFAAKGKGLIMLHPGTWYGYVNWPELNAKIVGGGARGHDKIGKFSVNAVKADHPIMKGVPASFEIEDELYYMNAEPEKIPAGTALIEVLAETSPSIKFQKPHPAVWITKHEKARVVGITLGHDERVHDHPAYKALLANAVKWASGK